MKRVRLGNTGMEVTELCFGTLPLGRLQAKLPTEEGAKAVRRARELGINFFDTAQTYDTYRYVREGLRGPKDGLVIATKSRARSYDEMKETIDQALEEMELDRIGIFHLHLIRSEEDFRSREGAVECLLDQKGKGIVQAIGVSAHAAEGVRAVTASKEIDVVMPIVNRRGMGIVDGTLEDMIAAVRAVKAEGKALYAMKPLGGGHLIDDIPESIEYVRNLGVFDAIAVGMKTPDEVEMNVGIFEGREETFRHAERLKSMRTHTKRLIVYDSCKACGTCEEQCDQGAIKVIGEKAVVDREKCILCGYCAVTCPVFALRVI